MPEGETAHGRAVPAGLAQHTSGRGGGSLRWVLPTADGQKVDAEVPAALVREVASGVLAGRAATVAAGTVAR